MDTTNATHTSVTERLRIAALDDVHLMDTPPEERFDRITRLARQIFDVPIAQINLIGEFDQYTKTSVPEGIPARRPAKESFLASRFKAPNCWWCPMPPKTSALRTARTSLARTTSVSTQVGR